MSDFNFLGWGLFGKDLFEKSYQLVRKFCEEKGNQILRKLVLRAPNALKHADEIRKMEASQNSQGRGTETLKESLVFLIILDLSQKESKIESFSWFCIKQEKFSGFDDAKFVFKWQTVVKLTLEEKATMQI